MSALLDLLSEMLESSPEVDEETRREALDLAEEYMDDMEDADAPEVMSWALEDAGVGREDRLSMRDEIERFLDD